MQGRRAKIVGSGLFFLILVLIAALAAAQEPSLPPAAATEEPGWLRGVGDRFHLETTEQLVSLSEVLDSFFPNSDNRRFDYRRTRLLAQLGLQLDSRGQLLVLQRLSGRVVLPRMEERLSLYFNGEGNDLNRSEDGATSDFFFLPTVEDTHFRFGLNTALRFVFTESPVYLLQNQIGIRLLPRWDPYDEVSGQLRIPLGKFLLQPGEILFWRGSSGFGETSRYDLDYTLGHGGIIRLHQEGTLTEESNGYEHLHSLAFLHQLTPTRGYAFVVEGRGETSPQQRMTQYLVGFTWKELVHADWLYVETGTKVTFAQKESFEAVPAIFFSFIADFNGQLQSLQPRQRRDKSAPPPP